MRTSSDSRAELLTMLALCPLLGGTRSLSTAAALCIVLVTCTIVTGLLQRILTRIMAPELKVATAVLLWTGVVAAADLILQIFWPQLHRALGIYVPLLIAVGMLRSHLVKAEGMQVLINELLVFCAVALVLGGLRQWAGSVTALALLPPGGLILAGLLLAAGNAVRTFLLRRRNV